jgi:GAF domain-containing protein
VIDERRAGRYERIHNQLTDLIGKSPNVLAAMATVCAVLHHKMPHHFWTGFYFVADDEELHIGPYQGPVACQVLKDRGVCLHCARTRQPVVVPDVERFPGHIACDARSKSEIALPLMKGDQVMAVLDIDAKELKQFDEDDVAPLMRILGLLSLLLETSGTMEIDSC